MNSLQTTLPAAAPGSEGATRTLARFIATHSLDAEPPELRQKAGRIIADTFASIVSGAGSEMAASLMNYAEAQSDGGGTVPVLGTDRKLPPELAALVNGSFGHALEFDDVFSMLPGHPAGVIVAALVGDIARRPISARALVDAFVIGYEVCARIAIAMTLEHHRVRGFHATGTLGLLGAAAALCRLRGLDGERTAQVLSVAASFASGLLGQIGTEMKPLHSGWAARNAIAATDLVAAGITGNSDLLESPKGFFVAYGTAASRVERVTEQLGSPWVILSPGVSLKKYPCCFAAHRGIDAILALHRRGVRFGDVAAIECRLPPKGLLNMIYSRPRTGLQAKFSMEYCFVATLLDGRAELSTFTDAMVLRPQVQDALRMVTCIEDPACEEGLGEAGGTVSGARGHLQIALLLKNGERLVESVAHAPGTPARELTQDELVEKFSLCARHAGLSPEQATRMVQALETWQRGGEDIVSLQALLQDARQPDAEAA